MEKLESQSLDLEKHSIEKIKELFPEVVTEGKVDFDKLRLILGDEVDESNEKYQFTWNGKSQTIKLAQKPSNGTLRPTKEESKNWDTTENLYIEGDNLEVLKQLQKTYFGKIKMIYIDPPYNTGGDFVYKDDFKDSIKNYKEQTNQISRSNADTSGRYHTDWLNMMYSRILLAKNLLINDGVIFLSIDDSEQNNLRKIMDEIFGESNFISQFIWKKKQGGGNDSRSVVTEHEYILAYAKNSSSFEVGLDKNYKLDDKLYPFSDEIGEYGLVTLDKSSIGGGDSLRFEIKGPDGEVYYPRTIKGKVSRWRWGKEKVEKDYEKLVFKNGKVYTKYYRPAGVTPRSLLVTAQYGRTETGNDDISAVFGTNIFSYPKPLNLIKHFVSISNNKDAITLDFFSGSATTAHAVMKLNAEDGGNRKFIMVQLPEKTDEKSEAYKAGYKTICEIGKERIRRAGEQIKHEMEKEGQDSSNLDIGFKVFKLDDTNIKEWDSSQEVTEITLLDQKEVFKEGRTTDDVLYEILLKYGVFDMPVSETLINDKVAYDVGQGDMVVALFDDITAEDVRAIGDLKPRVVIFKDSGFKDENVKLNALHNLQRQGVEDVKSI